MHNHDLCNDSKYIIRWSSWIKATKVHMYTMKNKVGITMGIYNNVHIHTMIILNTPLLTLCFCRCGTNHGI